MKRNAIDQAIIAVAALAALVFLHWAATQPSLIGVRELRGPFFVELLLSSARPNSLPLPESYRQAHLAVVAFVGLGSAALSLFIVLKSQMTPATRRLAAALALAPLSAAMFYFLWTHAAYREPLKLASAGWQSATFLFLAYAAGLASAALMARFFIGYPRQPSVDEVAAFRGRIQKERVDSVRTGWREKVYGRLIRAIDERRAKGGAWTRVLDTSPERVEAAQLRFFSSGWPLVLAVLLAALASAIDTYATSIDGGVTYQARRINPLNALPWALNALFIVVSMTTAYLALEYHHREAIADDRARIDWIYGTIFIAGILALAATPLSWAAIAMILPSLEPGSVSGEALFLGPAAFAFELFLAAVLAALAASIFYRGAVDPRLALQRITFFGVMGLVVAVLFVVIERAVAIKLAAWLNLPPETGALLAAGLVAGTLGPVRKSAEKRITGAVSRFLPLETLVQGQRKTVAVVLSDLSGYTALSARDEKQAMLAAALLQRLADKAATDFQGRVVKSMGDAVILVFDDAANAGRAMAALHEGFAPGAAALGLPALPVHSGAHYGEVTQTHDGDIYGQTVNIAARLQSVAEAGQRIVSAEFASAAALGEATARNLGARHLKNVPEPVECIELS